MTAATAPTPAPAIPLATRPGLRRGTWGMWMLILTELMIFGALIGSYFYVRAGQHPWPPLGIEKPPLGRISVFTFVLLGSSIPVVVAERAIRRGNVGGLRLGLAIAWLMGAAFFANQVVEYRALTFDATQHVYGSFFYAITGLHGAHLVLGLLMMAVVQTKAALGKFDADHHHTVEIASLYWHFVDAVWILVFSTVYLSPWLLQ
jgi:heme/copper-type cytochrome/quinol oxidase subunit 3